MSDDAPDLRPDEAEQIERARNWLKGHFPRSADQRYEPPEGKLGLVDAILARGWIEPNETWQLQALGVGFGDALAQKLMLQWVTMEDEYGCNPALHWPGTSIYAHPLTMISKRIERGDQVDVFELFERTCAKLSEMAFSGRYE